jgi:outer membrane lipoprotein SlyB
MSDSKFDLKVQQRPDGPLTDDFRGRVLAAKKKHDLSYWTVAGWAGFSGGFLGNITRYPNNIGAGAATRLAEVIGKLEAAAAGSNVAALFPDEEGVTASAHTSDIDTIEQAISTLRKHGLGVILVAGTSVAVSVTTVSA